MYDLLVLSLNEKRPVKACLNNICIKALNKFGEDSPKFYYQIWPFINKTYGILYKLFTKSGQGEFECCDEMFDFNTTESLKLPYLFPSLADDCFDDCVSLKINEIYAMEFMKALAMLLSCSPISTIAFLCRGQSYDKEIVLGTLSYNDFESMIRSGKIRTNICYIITNNTETNQMS